MEYLKVEGYSHLVRDKSTNSIINTNMSEYQEYISRKNAKNVENQKVQNLEKDLTNMKEDINEIKNLLRSLINESRSN
jgi:oligoendopeptidase F